MFDNVIAKWTNKKWYSGQIYNISGGWDDPTFSVYFLDDNEVLDLKEEDLKKPDKSSIWAKLNRRSILTLEFQHVPTSADDKNPKGRYYVDSLGKGKNINIYLCALMKHGVKGEAKYLFNVGYVHNTLLPDCFPQLKYPYLDN